MVRWCTYATLFEMVLLRYISLRYQEIMLHFLYIFLAPTTSAEASTTASSTMPTTTLATMPTNSLGLGPTEL